MTDRYAAALAYVRNAAQNAAPFPVGMCKQRTRLAFGVPSDGSVDAAEAWTRTDHRTTVTLDNWRPAILWWTGGANGHGHVAFTDPTPGLIWTVDYPSAGRWNLVSKARLEAAWPNLRYAGASLDIDGVQVIFPKPTPTPILDRQIDELGAQIAATKPSPVRRLRRQARQALLAARQIIRRRTT